MHSCDTLLIIGAGSAGSELAIGARQLGWAGPIVLVGEETHLPYHRPPLSKAFLQGTATRDSLSVRPREAYEKAGIELRLGVAVASIDRAAKTLRLHDGSTLAYDKLALCTGGRPRPLVAAGLVADAAPANLYTLRTPADAQAIREGLAPGTRLVVVGGGYVGLEVAASACQLGASVTVLEAQPRVLARVTGEAMSAFYTAVHREAGVDIRTGVAVQRIECDGHGRVTAVVCSDGVRLAADCVVVGVGMLPNVELAAAAGLAVDGGVVVDALSVTSDPDILAAGDCTVHDHALYGRRLRLESVPNALEQARAAVSALCGTPKPNLTVPWFWSDQYDLKLQMVGLSAGFEQCVLRGLPQERNFIAFYLRDGCVIAADAVNRPADFMVAKRLVAGACRIDAAALADSSIPLKQLLVPTATLAPTA